MSYKIEWKTKGLVRALNSFVSFNIGYTYLSILVTPVILYRLFCYD